MPETKMINYENPNRLKTTELSRIRSSAFAVATEFKVKLQNPCIGLNMTKRLLFLDILIIFILWFSFDHPQYLDVGFVSVGMQDSHAKCGRTITHFFQLNRTNSTQEGQWP